VLAVIEQAGSFEPRCGAADGGDGDARVEKAPSCCGEGPPPPASHMRARKAAGGQLGEKVTDLRVGKPVVEAERCCQYGAGS